MSTTNNFVSRGARLISQNRLVTIFISTHLLFAIFLGRLFALAPDEGGYLYTFNNLYGSKDANPQLGSGWITAPKAFLWVTYLPAKILNLIGVPDYLSIRLLSILMAAMSIILLKNMQSRLSARPDRFDSLILLFFFIPSIFLWTSVGLRETFILAEISLVLVGLEYLFDDRRARAISYLSLGSYGLLSTKSYLWICLALSMILVGVIWAIRRVPKTRYISLFVGAILLPCIAFASTTSIYAFEFLIKSVFHSDLSATAARSGDSMIQIAIPNAGPSGSSSNSGPTASPSPGSTPPSNKPGSKSGGSTLVTFHGDTTLIMLHFYLIDHPHSLFTRTLRAVGIKAKIDEIWASKVKSGLVKKTVKALPDSSSLSGYILKPGKIHDPLSVVRPSFLFMFGPIPLLDQGGFALNTVALESPLWWILYGGVLYRLIRYRKNGYLRDPVFMLASTYFLSLVAISALVEVNLGTSFRHRSILLIPLIVMFIRAKKRPASIAY